ncbi:MAG TPA: hypothetical protein VFT98_20200 [Myxococcota bacterium]|nr:hypothetical protein [Myxococcota bacterium]
MEVRTYAHRVVPVVIEDGQGDLDSNKRLQCTRCGAIFVEGWVSGGDETVDSIWQHNTSPRGWKRCFLQALLCRMR